MPASKKETSKKTTKKTSSNTNKKTQKKWSKKITETSDALELENRVFLYKDPKRIARSLKKSAENSKKRKGSPLQSSMSMLNFYINRAGKNLEPERKKVLEEAKKELHNLFEKEK